MRVLIDSGSYECGNMGDLAMLQVAIARLRELWPHCEISVITSSPRALESQCRNVRSLPLSGRDAFFEDHFVGRAHRLLPRPIQKGMRTVEVGMRRRWPTAMARTIAVKRALAGNADLRGPRVFVDAITRADLVMVSGAGFLTDAFVNGAFGVLGTLEFAAERGIPTAAFGQGVGPVSHHGLGARMRRVLPLLDLIAIREVRESRRLLEAAGVSRDRICVTGDDAIEPAHARTPPRLGDGLGVNLRVARYAVVNESAIDVLRPVLQSAAGRLTAPLVPVPIARHEECSDSATIAALLRGYEDGSTGGSDVDAPAKVMAEVSRCRVVVTGSYHAAVFALAQGIRAIGLARSEYYQWKFAGLADLFRGGCEVVRIDSATLERDLSSAIDRAWHRAPESREPLLKAARWQIDQGRAAYRRLKDIVGRRSFSHAGAGRASLEGQGPENNPTFA